MKCGNELKTQTFLFTDTQIVSEQMVDALLIDIRSTNPLMRRKWLPSELWLKACLLKPARCSISVVGVAFVHIRHGHSSSAHPLISKPYLALKRSGTCPLRVCHTLSVCARSQVEAINNVLNTGDVPNLYKNEDLDNIAQVALSPRFKRK
eukprot:3309655-Amphidinium_carterae.1